MSSDECELCGGMGLVHLSLVEWAPPYNRDKAWGSVQRCIDVSGCKAAFDAAGKPWPLVEQHAAPRRAHRETHEVRP